MTILDKIVEKKRERLALHGATLGFDVPPERISPLVPFVRQPFLICEIKRKSPSKGSISADLNALDQAQLYLSKGVKSVSILTEQDYFGGSLDDLMEVKNTFPTLAVLRKDFLLSVEDVEISYRAGADAILLIASILDQDLMKAMYRRARELGMQALVEVHSPEDIEKARSFSPDLTGINCRDLKRFTTDLTIPLQVRRFIDWNTEVLFESGIHSREEGRFALGSGFCGLLVGEAVVRNPGLITDLFAAFQDKKGHFWEKLYSRNPPYVKICGITNREDALHAMKAGADILGFVFAESKRRARPELLRELADLEILKVAVVVATEKDPPALEPEVRRLLEEGLIDAVQFHGSESPEECYRMAFPYYKAVRIKGEEDIPSLGTYRSPRVLIDAFAEGLAGGTGKVIPEALVEKVREKHVLWLAGGIGPDNIRMIMEKFSPELVDASSRLEVSPGKKDNEKVTALIKEIKGE